MSDSGDRSFASYSAKDPALPSILARLESGRSIPERAIVVVAHPDDETLCMGGRLATFQRLTLVHVTNGAFPGSANAAYHGFATSQAYSAARFRELARALRKLGVRPDAVQRYDFTDGLVFHSMIDLTIRLAGLLRGAEMVITHPYEGGHPDHDACAFGVQMACKLLAGAKLPVPQRLEFSGYHKRDGQLRYGVFWEDKACVPVVAHLTGIERWRKYRAMGSFRSQGWFTANFGPCDEIYRHAPDYDFGRLAPPGIALYDDYNWDINSERWCEHARAAMKDMDSLGRSGRDLAPPE